jgi:hypothetical protein
MDIVFIEKLNVNYLSYPDLFGVSSVFVLKRISMITNIWITPHRAGVNPNKHVPAPHQVQGQTPAGIG